MPAPRQISLADLAGLVGGELRGPPERVIGGVKGIEEAGPGDLTFLANPRYAAALERCRAGVVLVSRQQRVPPDLAVIRVDDPYLAFAQVLTHATAEPYRPLGVDPRAVVDPSAVLGDGVSIHPLAVVGAGCRLGERVVLHPGVVLGAQVEVGDDSVLYGNVVVYRGCKIGRRCIIHGGTVIGADGYGFVPRGEGHFKIPQIGNVEIGHDVEIGALNTIDRAALGSTRVHDGVKTDDHVHIAHGCVIGAHTLLVAQVGLSGSVKVGRGVVIGGQAGVAGHLEIGDGAQIAGGTGVVQSLPSGAVVGGRPAMPHRLWLRTSGLIKRLPDLFKRVRKLESRLAGPD